MFIEFGWSEVRLRGRIFIDDDVIDFTLGDPDVQTHQAIKDAACLAIQEGKTRYSQNAGLLDLRQTISKYYQRKEGFSYDPVSEIMVTVGAMEGLYLALISMLNPGDEVIMPRNTVMMIHNAWTCAVGNASDLRKAADDLDVLNEASMQAYLLKAGDKLTEAQLKEMLDMETYLTAAQCIELGLADRFADSDADMQAAQQQLARQKAAQKASDEMQQRREKAIAAINKYFG